MNRRVFLLGGIAGLTGCLGGQVSDRSTPTTQPPLPESVQRTVSPVHVDDIPPQFATQATVEVTIPEITPDHTAQLRVAVRNTGDEQREYVFNPDPPLAGDRSDSGPGRLLLARPALMTRESPECWRPGPYQHGDGRARVELAAGEAVQNTLDIWDVGDGPCLPPDRYRFAANLPRFELGDASNTWSFTLEIETPR